MINAALIFLLGCIVLVIILYIFSLIVNLLVKLMELPDEVRKISLLIVGLVGLLFLVLITIHAFQSAGAHPLVIWP